MRKLVHERGAISVCKSITRSPNEVSRSTLMASQSAARRDPSAAQVENADDQRTGLSLPDVSVYRAAFPQCRGPDRGPKGRNATVSLRPTRRTKTNPTTALSAASKESGGPRLEISAAQLGSASGRIHIAELQNQDSRRRHMMYTNSTPHGAAGSLDCTCAHPNVSKAN